jgi:hypothetical protein
MTGRTHHRHQYGERASSWPDTVMSRAFLVALARWAMAHHNDNNARAVLPIGAVGAKELSRVLRGLAAAQGRSGSRA